MNNDMINFASENYAGVQSAMMQAIIDANTGHVRSYGNDEYTAKARNLIRQTFGAEADVYFVFNGTGANNFGISAVTHKYHSIFCSDVSHLFVDESTAPEAFIGCRIYTVPHNNGKIVPEELKIAIKRIGDIHHPQPKVVTITQPTEYGTVYSIDELKAIKAICVENNMLLHVDGARLFNAAASLDVSLQEMITDTGVDVLTLGGTKAGMMFGEAVIFFTNQAREGYPYHLKRSMQLASKNRFIAAQFTAMLSNEAWHHLAAYTNNLAREFEQRVAKAIPGIEIVYPVETNAVFLKMSPAVYELMQQYANFYYWNDEREEIRLVFAFDNTVDEIDRFVALLADALKQPAKLD